MRTDELDFALPPELIAQEPPPRREASRLLHYRTSGRSIEHRAFDALPGLLREGDLLVFNDSRVIPARFTLRKATGGRVEGLFVAERSPGVWDVMLKNLGPAPAGATLHFDRAPEIAAALVERVGDGEYRLAVDAGAPAVEVLARIGRMPLPPYIRREKDADPRDAMDRDRYQTVYAGDVAGSVAAPTAGLHFTPELLGQLDARGVHRTSVTLHVGLGTFKPVSADALADHAMHRESYQVGSAAAAALNAARADGRRVVAVGTTAARVLESHPAGAPWSAGEGSTAIFIYPPYAWKHVSALITNFHLPRSTLVALVAAMTGLDEQRRIYAEAIAHRYRFFSYGDAMFVE